MFMFTTSVYHRYSFEEEGFLKESGSFASALFLSVANLLLTRYANFVYLSLDTHWLISTYLLRFRLQASLLVGMVCVLSSVVCIVQGRLLVAFLTAGLNINP